MTEAARAGPARARGGWRRLLAAALILGAAALALLAATWLSLRALPPDLPAVGAHALKSQVLARDGTPLSYTLENDWNTTDIVPLAAVPPLLQQAFIVSEDQRYYDHRGVDWRARGAALWQDLRAGAAVRGASTITEQVVRMLHPRPRTLWSRWLEGWEARQLEARCSKADILAFYLNQVPYAARRHGVAPAARYYFDRALDTLSPAELLSLAVLVRSPERMDLRRDRPRTVRAIAQLADRLAARGLLDAAQRAQVRADPLTLATPRLALEASHFVAHVLDAAQRGGGALPARLRTTLDPHFQQVAQQLLDTALAAQSRRHVHDGAVLVIDHARNEILAWVVSHGAAGAELSQGAAYDTVLTPRQPGSTMKPLLYAMALERGWTAATLIDDAELAEAVGAGQHTFHNYSHVHYGPLRLRETLGNSLNIPAVKTLKFVGRERFLERLHALGISSLTQHPDFYGDGLALGNGEVSLYEMAQAYTALARQGRALPLTALADDPRARIERRVYPAAVATLIANILADPEARRLEFGRGLQFPVATAIKTGTSTDYRDAWAIAFDYRYTVAAWMGNLDGSAMDGLTGATGPAMVLRSVFAELNRSQDTRDLPWSSELVAATICRRDGRPADGSCESMTEWFLPGTAPAAAAVAAPPPADYRLLQPTPGLQVARDPRIPPQFQALPMRIAPVPGRVRVEWYVDGTRVAGGTADHYAWPLAPGSHAMSARIWDAQLSSPHDTPTVRIHVR